MTTTPPSPRTPLFQPAGIAVLAGQVIALLAWANVVQTNITATLQLRPTNGSAPVPIVIQVTTTSNRAVSIGTATVGDDGVIDSAFCTQGTPAIPQRGQCYVQCAEQGGLGQVFFADYVYAGHGPVLGRIVDPGPAGGHGMMRRVLTADPAAATEIANQSPGVGQLWRLHSYSVQLVQGLTQTPLPTLRLIKATTNETLWQIPITTTAIGASTTAQLTWAIGLVQSSFTAVVGDEFHTAPLPPNLYLVNDGTNGDTVSTITDGIGANTNYGAASLVIEEWVMPN